MYEETKSGAHKVMTVVCILAAIGVVAACAKIVLDHVSGDGTVTSASDACENEEGMSALEKAGVFGGSKPRCEKADDESEE